jgi:hypothetical protein
VPQYHRRMRPRVASALVLLFASFAVGVGHATSAPAIHRTPIGISPIEASFDSQKRQTAYFVPVYSRGLKATKVTVTWKLTLGPGLAPGDAGKGSPDAPGSVAGVDLDCNNDGDGTTKPRVFTLQVDKGYTFGDSEHEPRFVWHHPDPQDSQPPGVYSCNHMLMGPHDHEGLVTVTVRGGGYRCTESYWGTNTSSYPRDLDNGTATHGTCVKD